MENGIRIVGCLVSRVSDKNSSYIQPEGVPDEYNFIQLVNVTSSSQHEVTSRISYPPGLVQGSEKLRVSLVGEFKHTTMRFIYGLLYLPSIRII